ncbi:MAG: hypothetical protein PF495_19460 [Spirochaetales bacterium]|jgi:hypothetical protein|nr:hypothetical protein [Spirochaetales bacterium]
MKKKLLLGLYDQKPVGTRREDLEYSLLSCYKPLFTFLYANPEMRVSLYFSGIIYEWLESEHPEINMLLADMVKRRQIELLSGGYYDPILTLIPAKDRTQQIEKMTTFIRKRFGLRPRCAWISEQVWNPVLINTLSLCGIRSVFQQTSPLLSHQDPFFMQELDKILCLFPVHAGLTENIHHNKLDSFTQNISSACKTEQHKIITIMADMGKLISHSLLTEKDTAMELCGMLNYLHDEYTDLELSVTSVTIQNVSNREHLSSGWYKREKPFNVEDFNEIFLRYPEIQHLYGKLLYSAKLIPGIKNEKTLKKLAGREILKGESFGAF